MSRVPAGCHDKHYSIACILTDDTEAEVEKRIYKIYSRVQINRIRSQRLDGMYKIIYNSYKKTVCARILFGHVTEWSLCLFYILE